MNIESQSVCPPPLRWDDEPRNGCHDLYGLAPAANESGRRWRERDTFEIHNTSGKLAHGIEIELAGFGEEDIFHTYYLNRYGAPEVIRTPGLIRVRAENLWRATAETLSPRTTSM